MLESVWFNVFGVTHHYHKDIEYQKYLKELGLRINPVCMPVCECL